MASKYNVLVHHFLLFFALTTLYSVNYRKNNFNIKGLHSYSKTKRKT